MKAEKRNKLIGSSIFVGVCAALVVLIANYYFARMSPGGDMYLADYTDVMGQVGRLSDMQRWLSAYASGFMTVGVVIFGVGLLTWISTTGLFDMLGYGASVLWDRVTFKNRNTRFYDYKTAREEKRKGKALQWSILIVGGVLLGLAILCSVLFYYV